MGVVTEHFSQSLSNLMFPINKQTAELFPTISKAKCIRKPYWLIS